MINKSFEECKDDENQTVYADWEYCGFRALVLRGPVSVNGYVGVKKDHFLWGREYGDVRIDCHGGLTFSMEGDERYFPEGWYWFGWDYAHYGDKCFFDLKGSFGEGHGWTPDEVKTDVCDVLEQFKEMKELTEN